MQTSMKKYCRCLTFYVCTINKHHNLSEIYDTYHRAATELTLELPRDFQNI